MRFVDNLPTRNVSKCQSVNVSKEGRFGFFKNLRNRFDSLSQRKKIAVVAGGGLVLLVLLATIGYGIYSYLQWNRGSVSPNRYRSTKEIKVDVGEPKDFESPINGILYTGSQGEIFDRRRPLAIMVNNHVDARPAQTGLPEADMIFEAVAEGGITRFLAIYQANDAEKVGPVRSVRVYYLDWSSEFHAWVAHWGGACTPNSPANAYDYMAKNGIANLDAMWLGECPTCAYWREPNLPVAWEHNGFTATQKLYQASAEKWSEWAKKVPFDRWFFKGDLDQAERPAAGSFTFNFWNLPEYEVTWTYDPSENVYLRSQGGQPHKDAATGRQLTAKNVVVQFTDERSAGDGTVHLLYQTLGSGPAKIFLDGNVIDATWKKTDRQLRTRYFETATGNEVKFNRGQVWVEIVPRGNEISYSSSEGVSP